MLALIQNLSRFGLELADLSALLMVFSFIILAICISLFGWRFRSHWQAVGLLFAVSFASFGALTGAEVADAELPAAGRMIGQDGVFEAAASGRFTYRLASKLAVAERNRQQRAATEEKMRRVGDALRSGAEGR